MIKLSIVVPVYNPNLKLLKRLVKSTPLSERGIELVLTDDATSSKTTLSYLSMLKNDKNVKVIFREINGHICLATNDAIEAAEGEYVLFADQDDLFPEGALSKLISFLHENPEAEIVYGDEDKIGKSTNSRHSPHFKPQFNFDLLLSQNYINHPTIIRKQLILDVGMLRVGYEGSQDYDLLLRCVKHVNSKNILHIPEVLYHWRALPGSTAYAASEKSYTEEAGVRALEDLYVSTGEAHRVLKGRVANTYRVLWSIPDPNPYVDIIVPTKDKLEILKPCIDSILEKTAYKNFKITIVDNSSVEEATLDYFNDIEKNERVQVLKYPGTFNYSSINNFAVNATNSPLLLLLNNDTKVITPNWLTELVSLGIREKTGCVGAKLLYEDDTIQHAGVILGVGGVANHAYIGLPKEHLGYFGRLTVRHNVSAVTGACLMVRRSIWEQLGGLEERLAVAFNDVDFCLKVMELGYNNVFTPFAELYHYESKSRSVGEKETNSDRFKSEVQYMRKKWGDVLDNDPHYSPHLSLHFIDYRTTPMYGPLRKAIHDSFLYTYTKNCWHLLPESFREKVWIQINRIRLRS